LLFDKTLNVWEFTKERLNPFNYKRDGANINFNPKTSTSPRFRGEPNAFGTGSRSERVNNLVDEAARAANIDDIYNYVDDISYAVGDSSSFYVDDVGVRYLQISSDVFGKTKAGQLIEASHEIVHAQQYAKILNNLNGDAKAASNIFNSYNFGSMKYAWDEMVAEKLAMLRVKSHLGGLTPQQIGHTTRYVNNWKSVYQYEKAISNNP
jgi:hypothetical protein